MEMSAFDAVDGSSTGIAMCHPNVAKAARVEIHVEYGKSLIA